MDAGLLSQLCRASLEKGFQPERDVPWGSPPLPEAEPILPDPVLSLHGGADFGRVAPLLRARLARHEVASMFSAFIRFEGFLNEWLSGWVTLAEPGDGITRYALHVIEEEARHSRMFARLIGELGVGAYPRRGWLGLCESAGMGLMRRSRLLFLLGMLGVEEISDALFARILAAPGGDPVLRGVCRIHRVEESRHMEFARQWLRESYAEAGPAERWLLRVLAPAILSLIFEVFVDPDVYRRSGVAPGRRQALALWWRTRRSAPRRALRRDCTARITRLFEEMGAIPASTRPLWQAARLLA